MWPFEAVVQEVELKNIRSEPRRLREHVAFLSSLKPARSYENPESLERAADYIHAQFARSGLSTANQTFKVGRRTFRNVRTRLGGSKPGELLVIGAHYDTAGEQPGADDNASGVAGLLELARLLAPIQHRLPGPVELVAYSLEEPPNFGSPTMGSYVHAQWLARQDAKVKLMVALEMIGYFRDEEGSQTYPFDFLRKLYPSKGDFIGIVGRMRETVVVQRLKSAFARHSALPVHTIAAPSVIPGMDLSDHRNYWEAGYKAVMFTDTAFMRNPNYHRTSDRPETLDYARMSQVVDGLMGIVFNY